MGNPFLSVGVSHERLSETVISLACGISAGRAFDRLSLLADALESAGCDRAGLLGHLRSGGPHSLGCWPLDLVLGEAVADPVPPGASARWW